MFENFKISSHVVLEILFLFFQENMLALYTITQIFYDSFFEWWNVIKKINVHNGVACCRGSHYG